MNLVDYYFIKNENQLSLYLEKYIPLVLLVAQKFNIDLSNKRFTGDHLGLQVLSNGEFNICDKELLKFSKIIKDGEIHDRKNRLYEFNKPIQIDSITIPFIETFEPKPNSNISKLRAGIEHMAFVVKDYEEFYQECLNKNIPIEKRVDFDDRSSFFKTKFINGVEIEFRTEPLKFIND